MFLYLEIDKDDYLDDTLKELKMPSIKDLKNFFLENGDKIQKNACSLISINEKKMEYNEWNCRNIVIENGIV